MSDRRPSKPELSFQLRVHYPHSSEHGQYASWDHILAVVRRGVESGTIKGTEIGVFPTFEGDHVIEIPGQRKKRLADELEPGTYFVIGPVSDGGSET